MVIHHTTTTEKRGHYISTIIESSAASSCPAGVLPVVPRPTARTGKDSFATRLEDVPVLYPYIQLSPVDLYHYATSAGVTVPLQTCLFNSARE